MCWIAGFSFGAWIGMQLLMRRPEITGFLSVSPPANMYDFSFLAPCPASGLITHGDQDDIVPQDSVTELIAKLAKQKDVIIDFQVLKGSDHFYNDHLEELEQTANGYLDRRIGEIEAAIAAEAAALEDSESAKS